MDIYTSGHYGGTATENRIVEQVNGSVRRLVREHIMLATLSHLDECEGIASMPEATQLRSLALWQRDLPPHHQELVRRNASTLERLHINQINCASVAGLLVDDNGRATVYPRLKHLYIRWCNSRDGPMAEAAGAVDQPPFPCLETLSCRGEFPLTLQIVQGQGRAQLRHLDIEVDGAVLAALMAGAGAFTSLAYVALRARGGETFSIVRDGLFAALCALGPQVQTACCWHLDSGHIERALSTVLVPASLQRLDLAYTLHTVDQAIAVLCACPALLKAGFGLCDLPDARGRGMPDEDLLVSYQHKYRTHAASVAYVGFSRLTFASARRAAEMIVLLVDILPSIVRATVVASGVGCSTDVLKGIAAACKRPPYTNRPHLGHVRFAFENCW
ncbi:hypothetical protein IWQ57_004870 [Coemansia nantahalensis]|uniref:Uncharacterized protein n=1 Tax=Coemansia nantahalensis TaxID=2789366 RepID=A0ACC1JQF3_9FUNG|nr:hypothetical protein IWQ57_004870 [Coemansia nantahalensis]